MAQPSITGPRLPVLKSTSQRGKESENLVKKYFDNLGYIFVTENIWHYYAELDLLFLSPCGELVVVEVKSVSESMVWRDPVSQNQRSRLRRAFESILRTSSRSVRMHLAAVSHSGEITIFQDFLAG